MPSTFPTTHDNLATNKTDATTMATDHPAHHNDTASAVNAVETYLLAGELVNTVAASGSTETLPDINVATIHHVTLTANCTFTFPTAAAGKSFTVWLRQDGTGTRTVTWPGTVRWSAGLSPTLTTTINKTDVISFVCANGTNWDGFVGGLNY